MEDFEIIPEQEYEVNTYHIVDITYIKDPDNFYIRSIKYRPVVSVIEFSKPTEKVSKVYVGDIVLYNWGQSCGASRYFRGKVIEVFKVDGFYDFNLFALDYGFVEKDVPLEFLRKCRDEFLKVPPLAIFCQLHNCFPPGVRRWPAHSIEGFQFYTGSDCCKMYIEKIRENKLVVSLINSRPQDVAIMLAQGAYSKLGPAREDPLRHPKRVRKPLHYHFKNLSINDTLRVQVVSGSSVKHFYVAEVGDYIKHLKEQNNITFYAKQEFRISQCDLFDGMVVCVKNESRNMYDRALIKKFTIGDPKVIVHLVDHGIDIAVPCNILKYMPDICLRTPVLAIFCKAYKIQAKNNGIGRNFGPGLQFNITIKRLGYQFEKPHLVELEDIKEPLGTATISPAELPILKDEKEERAEMEAARETEEEAAQKAAETKNASAFVENEDAATDAYNEGAAAEDEGATAVAEGEGATAVAEDEGATAVAEDEGAIAAVENGGAVNNYTAACALTEVYTEEIDEGAVGTSTTTAGKQEDYDDALFAERV